MNDGRDYIYGVTHDVNGMPYLFAKEELIYCKDCAWYDPPHIEHKDGSREEIEGISECVTIDEGINVGGICKAPHKIYLQAEGEARTHTKIFPIVAIARNPYDYCSRGDRKK